MLGFVRPGEPMTGLEIRTEVNLPMGSGLGTSSVLAATVLKALLSMRGEDVSVQELSDLVLALEQFMTTGGGWQDQVGGIYPGAKLTMTGPGPRQRLRVEPVPCPAGFAERFVLYYTGIRRIAKDLLGQVVGRYLAREVQAVQVLHSIKTLAVEMAYAMKESDWDYLGSLLDRHWQLNQILDPHTTNAPINALLERVRPTSQAPSWPAPAAAVFSCCWQKRRTMRRIFAGFWHRFPARGHCMSGRSHRWGCTGVPDACRHAWGGRRHSHHEIGPGNISDATRTHESTMI